MENDVIVENGTVVPFDVETVNTDIVPVEDQQVMAEFEATPPAAANFL